MNEDFYSLLTEFSIRNIKFFAHVIKGVDLEFHVLDGNSVKTHDGGLLTRSVPGTKRYTRTIPKKLRPLPETD